MSWRWSMLIILVAITLASVAAAVLTGAYHLWAAVPQALTLLGLWAEHLYRYAPRVRVFVVKIVARFTSRTTRMKMTARFAITDELTAEEITDEIKRRYSGRMVTVLPSAVRISVHIPDPGWQMVYSFSEPAPTELNFDEADDRPAGYVLFTVPDMHNSIDSARALVNGDILPLFEALSQDLPLRLEAVQMTIYFTKSPNPYLSAYIQNIDTGKLTTLDCTVLGEKPGASASIKLDLITLSATSTSDLRYMVDQHLGLGWITR